MAAYVLAGIVDNYPAGQEAALQVILLLIIWNFRKTREFRSTRILEYDGYYCFMVLTSATANRASRFDL